MKKVSALKKIIFGGLFLTLIGVGLIACKKEEIKQNDLEENINSNSQLKLANHYTEKTRSYVWVEENTKLDCSQDGTGCTVSLRGVYEGKETDLLFKQAVYLLKLQKNNLNTYFINNELDELFPIIYSNYIDKIKENRLNVTFEFPFLKITNNSGELIHVNNYESLIQNNEIVSLIQGLASYTKKVSVNTEGGGVWKCVSAGDNCKVSAAVLDLNWLSNNPDFAFIPNQEVVSSEVLNTPSKRGVLFKTKSNQNYGVEFK